MTPPDNPLARLHADLGLRRLNPVWAKLEILLGLLAAGAGVALVARSPAGDLAGPAAGVGLFALGGYLALAGHRSHLYQSNNRLAAYLAELLRTPPKPGDRP
jgi:hypothetical protein